MAHQGDFGGNLSNPLGQFTPSSPTPVTIGAQAIQAPFHANVSQPFSGATMPWSGHPDANALVPPAMAPQTFQPESHPYWTMPQAGVPNAANPLQHFSGPAVQPLHGEELAARLAAINRLMSEPCEPNNYNTHGHGWLRPSPPPPPQQQEVPPASGYPTLQPLPAPQDAHFHQRATVDMAPNGNIAAPPVGAQSYGATSWAPPVPHPGWPASWTPPLQQPGGQTSWAPPAQQPGGQASWAPPQQPPSAPVASPADGSGQVQPPAPGKTFEEFLMDAGVLDEWTVDDLVVQGLMKDLQAELGQEKPDGPMASHGGIGPPPPPGGAGAVGSFYGLSRDQVGLYMMARAQEEETEDEEPVGRDPEAAAEARARRSRRMAMRKGFIARARPGN